MKSKFILLPSLAIFSAISVASAANFDSLWKQVLENSHGVRAAQSAYDAGAVSSDRANRTWAPRLLLSAQATSTNDAGSSLFSLLGSRSLQATDLNPNTINHPSREWYERGGLTLDWSLFEGGAKKAISSGKQLEAESKALLLKAEMKDEYARLAQNYAKFIALKSEENAYVSLRTKIQSLISRYQLGSKENPVGYSGLLGMKSLLNRLESSLDQNHSEIASIENYLQVKSGNDSTLTTSIDETSLTQFIEKTLASAPVGASMSAGSMRSEALKLDADAQSEYAKAEKAKWLPKFGLFASGNLTAGPRDSGTSSEYGAYLQWELFNASNIGASKEATLRAESAKERANEMTQNEKIERTSLAKSVPTLKENIKRMEASLELTAEQVGVTERLFRNGSINALQFVEVLSRRADVVQNKRDLEYAYVDRLVEQYLSGGNP